MNELDTVKLEELLPQSLKSDENVLHAARAIDPELQTIAYLSDIPAIFANLEKLTSEQLDQLAYSFDATVWRDTWPIEIKRSMLLNVVKEKRLRGTVSAVRSALSTVQASSNIVEWWQTTPKGTPHTFKIIVTQSDIGGVVTDEMQADIIALIEESKPLRSHYDLTIQRAVDGGVGAKAVLRVATFSRLTGGIS